MVMRAGVKEEVSVELMRDGMSAPRRAQIPKFISERAPAARARCPALSFRGVSWSRELLLGHETLERGEILFHGGKQQRPLFRIADGLRRALERRVFKMYRPRARDVQ